jgi:hypothetical protein
MGRIPWSSRVIVEESLCLSARELHRAGVFKSGRGSRWQWTWAGFEGKTTTTLDFTLIGVPDRGLGLRLDYTHRTRGSAIPMIEITTTRPRLGGLRYWLRCPIVRNGVQCGKRVGRLYIPPRGSEFGCRLCHDLIYNTARTHDSRKDAMHRDPFVFAAALLSPKRRHLALAVLTGAWSRS